MEHRFGRAAPFALGVEEELLLLDPDSGMPAHNSSRLVPQVDPPTGTVMHDVYEALVETASAVSRNAIEARRSARDIARRDPRGGRHARRRGHPPAAPFGEAPHGVSERYRESATINAGSCCGAPRPARLHIQCRHARSRDYDPRLQPHGARTCGAAGTGRALAVLARDRLRLRHRAGAAVPRLSRADIPRSFVDGRTTRPTVGAIVAARDVGGLHVPVVGPSARTRSSAARGARDGRPRALGSVCGLAALVHGLVLASANDESTEGRSGRGADSSPRSAPGAPASTPPSARRCAAAGGASGPPASLEPRAPLRP